MRHVFVIFAAIGLMSCLPDTSGNQTSTSRTATSDSSADNPMSAAMSAGAASFVGEQSGAGMMTNAVSDSSMVAGTPAADTSNPNRGGRSTVAGTPSRTGGMSTTDGPTAGSPASGGIPSPTPECFSIDKVTGPTIYPPAGVQVGFRLLDCDGNAVRRLQPDEVTIVNDERGEAFGAGGESGSVSGLGTPSEIGLYTVLALDFSDSIFDVDAEGDIIEAARTFVAQRVTEQLQNLKHHIMIMAFGRTAAIEVIQDFTQDDAILNTALDELARSDSRGSPDLYNAYMQALIRVNAPGQDLALVERFVVVLTDGPHGAGDEADLRRQALMARDSTDASVYTVAVSGEFDADKLRELASQPDNFLTVDNSADLVNTVGAISAKVDAIAASNYVIGVCTPVSFGTPSLTIRIDRDGTIVERQIAYSTERLVGDLSECDATLVSGDYDRVCEAGTTQCEEQVLVACDEWGASAERIDCAALPGICQNDACSTTECGDGRNDPTEACDDGNQIDTDECTNACTVAVCGDGVVGPDEQCDDGNAINTDTCTNTCQNARCGDGIVGPDEECDDGNDIDGDTCTNLCSNRGYRFWKLVQVSRSGPMFDDNAHSHRWGQIMFRDRLGDIISGEVDLVGPFQNTNEPYGPDICQDRGLILSDNGQIIFRSDQPVRAITQVGFWLTNAQRVQQSTWVLEASNDGANWTNFGRIITPTINGCLTVWLDVTEFTTLSTLSTGQSVDVGGGYRIRCSGHRARECLSAQIETIGCGVEAGWYRLSWTRNGNTRQDACDVFCTLADSMPVVSCDNAGEIADDERLHAFPPNGVTFDHPGGQPCDWPRVGRLQTNGSVNGNRIDVQCTW